MFYTPLNLTEKKIPFVLSYKKQTDVFMSMICTVCCGTGKHEHDSRYSSKALWFHLNYPSNPSSHHIATACQCSDHRRIGIDHSCMYSSFRLHHPNSLPMRTIQTIAWNIYKNVRSESILSNTNHNRHHISSPCQYKGYDWGT